MDYVISGDIFGTVLIGSYSSSVNIKTIRSQRSTYFGECPGIPGVRVKLQDLSDYTPDTNTTSIAAIVGHSKRGQFNKIIKIRNIGDISKNLGNGFNSYKYNQGLYASKAVIENGGFVEYVRPYSEEVNLDSINKRELKSDSFVVSYNYNQNAVKSILIEHFAATRYQIDGYSTFGRREIFNIEDVISNGIEYEFSLNKAEETTLTENIISLFSIINLDPTLMNRSKTSSDFSSDTLSITTANHFITKTVTQTLILSAQPTDGDIIFIYDHHGIIHNFEFDSNSSVISGNIQINIGANLTQTISNLLQGISVELPNIKFSSSGSSILGTMEFGIDDVFNQLLHENIFNESVDSGNVINIVVSNIEDINILVDDSIGRLFLSMGACEEIVKSTSISSSKMVQYKLNQKGTDLAKIFVLVDYVLSSEVYTFYGTIIPYTISGVNLFIEDVVNSSFDSFKLIINSHVDLLESTQSSEFNLGQSINIIECEVASTTNVLLNGLYSIDGILLNSGDLVLVKNQTNLSKNGIYVASVSDWVRYADLSTEAQFNSDIYIRVTNGTVNTNTNWKLAIYDDFTLELSNISFYQTTQSPTPISTFKVASYNENDPAIINNSIWKYDPNTLNTLTFKYAWTLFLDKSKSNCDYLVSSGTNIKNLFIKGLEELDSSVMQSMLDVCNYRKDCFCIFDGVDENNIETAILKMAGAGSFGYMSRWGALFDGRSYFTDIQYTKMESIAVKTIEIASIITRNRRGGLFWIPPAGKEYGTISPKYSTKPKFIRRGGSIEDPNTEMGKLYGFHINPSRFIDGLTVIFGEKTLFKENSDCNRLHVTMLIAGLHKKLPGLLVPRMLKLNTLKLRSTLKEEISLILNGIKRAYPSGLDRFDVICDSSNNTRISISEGKLIVDIKIYPTKSSECIILRTTVERTDKSLSVANFELVNG